MWNWIFQRVKKNDKYTEKFMMCSSEYEYEFFPLTLDVKFESSLCIPIRRVYVESQCI